MLTGEAMSTTYHIKIVAGAFEDMAGVHQKIKKRLATVEHSMSTYLPNSEISRFNALTTPGEPFAVSRDFLNVMGIAHGLYQITDGAWDGTVLPLVDLWGFGREERTQIPKDHDVREALERVGFDRIIIDDAGYLVKKTADVRLDLASIAKGYAVDQVAGLIRENGYSNFLVEIGGEVYAAGHKKNGSSWMVGINTPDPAANPYQVFKALALQDRALATSGDYRKYIEVEGKRYSHIIDPHTGRPVAHGVVSASVLADNCAFADGLATALMVMAPEKGLALVDQLDGVECLLISREPEGAFSLSSSPGFELVQ